VVASRRPKRIARVSITGVALLPGEITAQHCGEAAIEQAEALAGDEVVGVNGGTIACQCLNAGLLDEVWIDLVPVLLGDGTPFFDGLTGAPVDLDGALSVTEGVDVTHLRYRVRYPCAMSYADVNGLSLFYEEQGSASRSSCCTAGSAPARSGPRSLPRSRPAGASSPSTCRATATRRTSTARCGPSTWPTTSPRCSRTSTSSGPTCSATRSAARSRCGWRSSSPVACAA
jgi:hypothetical protein